MTTRAYLDSKNICDTDESKKHMLDLITFCKKMEPLMVYYKCYFESDNEVKLVLPYHLKK